MKKEVNLPLVPTQSYYVLTTGIIKYWNSVSKCYEVELDGERELDEQGNIVTYAALDLNAPVSDRYGTVHTHSYKLDDRVLLASPVQSGIRWSYIIGIVGVAEYGLSPDVQDAPQTVTNLFSTASDGTEGKHYDRLYDKIDDRLQRKKEFKTDEYGSLPISFQGSLPGNTVPGTDTLSGMYTAFTVSDYHISIAAGSVFDAADALFGTRVSSSTTRQEYTVASTNEMHLLGDNVEHLERLALSVSAGSKQLSEDTQRVYTYNCVCSPYAYGVKTVLCDTQGRGIAAIHHSADGVIELDAVRGIRLRKTFDITATTALDPAAIQPLPIDISTCTSYEEVLDKVKDSTQLNTTEPITTISGLAPMPRDNEPSTEVDDTAVFNNGIVDTPVVAHKAEACIDVLETGGILIRDAWGSEIRMEGGNIQITAANNMTHIAGRDMLDIVNGVRSISASEEVQIGAAKRNVVIQAAKNICVTGKEVLDLAGGTVHTTAEKALTIDSGLTDIAGTNGISIRSADGVASMSGQSVQVYGEATASIVTDKAAVELQQAVYIGGASGIQAVGGLSVCPGGITVDGIITPTGNKVTKTSVTASTAFVEIKGPLTIDGIIKGNTHVIASGSVIGSVIAGKNNSKGLVQSVSGKLSTSDIKAKINSTGKLRTERLVSLIKERTESSRLLKSVFSLVSKAYTIWQPVFSRTLGKASVSVPIENKGKKSYIYPGEEFWTAKDRMLVVDQETNKVVSTAPVSSLRLNSANTQEE